MSAKKGNRQLLERIQEAEIGLSHGMNAMRDIREKLGIYQQNWARALDVLREVEQMIRSKRSK